MDWEGGESTFGQDTNSYYMIDTESGFDSDCTSASSPCPISGTYSGRTGVVGGGAFVSNLMEKKNVIHDFIWKWVSEDGSAARPFGVVLDIDHAWLCGVMFNEVNQKITVWANGGSVSYSASATSAGTVYYIRERIADNENGTFACNVYVDTTPSYGTGGFYSGSTTGTFPSAKRVSGVAYFGAFSDTVPQEAFDFIIDNSILCDEGSEGTIPVGQQCVVPALSSGVLAYKPGRPRVVGGGR
jgi:hypothetical protein